MLLNLPIMSAMLSSCVVTVSAQVSASTMGLAFAAGETRGKASRRSLARVGVLKLPTSARWIPTRDDRRSSSFSKCWSFSSYGKEGRWR